MNEPDRASLDDQRIQSKVVGAGRTAGERIKQAREAAGISQEAVAAEFHRTQQTVSNWEADKSKVPKSYRSRLADLLGIERADLEAWLSADDNREHKATRRELSETVKVLEQFVDQYQELGHTYRRLDETSAMTLRILQQVTKQQSEMLKLLKRLAGEEA